MYKFVILRHGESTWNLENKFTGWTDVGLTSTGINEAKNSGKLLRSNGFLFDYAFTSVLKRAKETLRYSLNTYDKLTKIKVEENWRLNERHYGSLQGLDKKKAALKFGQKQILEWRKKL